MSISKEKAGSLLMKGQEYNSLSVYFNYDTLSPDTPTPDSRRTIHRSNVTEKEKALPPCSQPSKLLSKSRGVRRWVRMVDKKIII